MNTQQNRLKKATSEQAALGSKAVDKMGPVGTTGGLTLCVQAKAKSSVQHIYGVSSNIMERMEVLDMKQEEADELLEEAPWHIQKWMQEKNGTSEDKAEWKEVECPPLAPLTPNAPADKLIQPKVEVLPSTSRKTAPSRKPPSRKTAVDSDLGSDCDDQFDEPQVEVPTISGIHKDIPDDDELDEPIRDIINNIETGMDDEADRLIAASSSFTWVDDFESFGSVREEFSGPAPGPIKDYASPYDAFIDIWDRDIIELIVRETNRYAYQTIEGLRSNGRLGPSSRLHAWTDTNADEIMLLFGMLMYMAIDQRASICEYWAVDVVLEMPGFRSLMPINRYLLLNRFLHFIDNNAEAKKQLLQTKESSSTMVKLAPIVEHLGEKFSSLYNLLPDIVIDESLTLFKGSLSWIQTKAIIKSYELCEAQTGYMAKFQIYTGQSGSGSDPTVGVKLGSKSTKAVLELLQGLEHRGHCVTMDNFYSCPSLARYLKSLGFDCLGTLRASRRHVPSDIANVSEMPKGTIISCHCGDVSITAWKYAKTVNIISTYHKDDTFLRPKADKPLVVPVCVKDYNKSMGGIDLKDQKLSKYLLERKKGVKWYVKMFKKLLNVSVHNAFVMYMSSLKRCYKPPVTHRDFRYELAGSIVRRHRPTLAETSKPVSVLMRLRRDVIHVPKSPNGSRDRKRCVICYREKINKMVRSQCTTCDAFLCFENCWEIWHSAPELPGDEIHGRKRKRND